MNSLDCSKSSLIDYDPDLEWFVDEFIYFREMVYLSGWMFHRKQEVVSIGYMSHEQDKDPHYETLEGYGLPSPHVSIVYGTPASNCGFSCRLHVKSAELAQQIALICVLDNGQAIHITGFAQRKLASDPFHVLNQKFFKLLCEKPEGNVLEIGSRNRSGFVRRSLVPSQMNYTGMDIRSGENVDVTGDAHALTNLFKPNTFDAIFTMSVFEHLLMPWKVVLEMNHVLKAGGLVLVTTHHTFPLHETPWDFWRFSDQAWHGLFNQFTGFEVVSTAVGESAAVVPTMLHAVTLNIEQRPAYLASAALCRKTHDTHLTWEANMTEILQTMYPN